MKNNRRLILISAGLAAFIAAVLAWCLFWPAHCPFAGFLLTLDQQGDLLMHQKRYSDAAKMFRDPFRKATAFYLAGEFKEAAGLFAGFDTAEGAYNDGNALAMQGQYSEAAKRYERALELRPGWKDAELNLAIARQSAERLKKEGGEMTGGQLEADEYVFDKQKQKKESAGEETVEGGQELTDADIRATWLRRVQTKPADFLKAKFAFQAAEGEEP